MKIITTQNAPQAIGPYSQAIATDSMVFVSGQIPLNPQTMEIVSNDIVLQTEQVIHNIQEILKTVGLSLENIVKTTVFMTNLQDFPSMNKEYERQFGNHKPARATVEVSKLPKGVDVEIECIAMR